MFDLSLEKIAVLMVVALFVLGPERLPAAAGWIGDNIRRVKAYVATANQQIRSELGPEFDQLRQPLAELRAPLQELRALCHPRATAMRYLLTEPVTPQPAPTEKPPAATTVATPAPSGPGDLTVIDIDAT